MSPHFSLPFLLLLLLSVFVLVSGQCDDCMDGMPMPGCPSPSFCGFQPTNCTACAPIKTSACKGMVARWCANVTCSKMCMDGMPMEGCPDPGECGFKPIACKGCVFGKSMPDCPHPEWCGNYRLGTPPCYNCTNGVSKDQCPDPNKCGFAPACDDCMPGMSMPGCPDPDACAAAGLMTGCVMQMYFNLDHSACILVKQWNISARGEWALAVMMIIIAAFAREGVAFYRSYRLAARKKAKNQSKSKYSIVDNPELKNSLLHDNKQTMVSVSSSSSSSTPWYSLAIDSFFYCLQHTLSYLLMLVIMTYNFYLFVAVLLSFSVAHFTINYSWGKMKEKRAIDSANNRINQSINGKNDKAIIGGEAKDNDPHQNTGGDHCCEDFDFDE